MKTIAYVGAGRLAAQLACLFESSANSDRFRVIWFGQPAESAGGKHVLAFERHLDDEFAGCDFYLALGYRQLAVKRKVLRQLQARKRRLPVFVHPSAYVHPTSTLGDGCVVYPGAVIGPDCRLSGGVLLNTAVNLAHDVRIGEVSYLAPSVTASGFSCIGAECFVGTGALLTNDINIGDGCRLGIGSVVTHSLAEGTHGLGNPFRKARFELR